MEMVIGKSDKIINKDISGTIAKIEEILESRAFVGAMKKKFSPGITKFHLMNNYGWKDKRELEQEEDKEVNVIVNVVNDGRNETAN